MRSKMFAVLILVILLSLVSSTAFAAEPQAPAVGTEVYWGGWAMLGEVWEFVVPAFDPVLGDPTFGPFLLNWPVDVWLYRPDTDPFAARFPAEWAALPGPWWIKAHEQSGLRRQTYPRFSQSDHNGWYYAKFLFPRDEVWYPCGFPCKWNCNVFWGAPIFTFTEFHSPYELWFSYPDLPTQAHYPLFWPWALDWWAPGLGYINPYYFDYPATLDPLPYDTVHPMEVWIVEGWADSAMYIFEFGLQGYQWKTTDPAVANYYADWPYICGDPAEWPVY